MKLTIGIKALNEAEHIGRCIAAALAAAAPYDGEVILADSGSTDGTIEIAQGFPIRILQLADPADRSCGAGAQLAFQAARGEYFYLLDGDMVIDPQLMPTVIAFLDANPRHAGVAGRVREVNVANAEFEVRAAKLAHEDPTGDVDRLDGGGLYRAAAVREAGYFADRNLHAFEEIDLAARLTVRGWKLARLATAGVDHYGHTIEGYRLMLRRVRSGYTGGTGEVLRAALGQPQLGIVLRRLGHIRKGLGMLAWWLVLAVLIAWPAPAWITLPYIAAPFLWFWWRRGSLRLVPYSFLIWNTTALGLVTGLFRRRIAPTRPLDAIDLSKPA